MQVELDPDPAWVEALSGHGREAALHAVGEAQGERKLFSHLEREHDREGRDSYIEVDAPLELHALVRLLRPVHVVEVGVSSGVSSAYLLNALDKNGTGTLHSVDLPSLPRQGARSQKPSRNSWSLPPGRSTGWAVPFPLLKRWDLRLGDKADVLPILARGLPRIDLLLYDVPHEDTATRREFRLLDSLVPPGGVIIVDHGPRGGLCDALRGWARSWKTRPVRRQNLGLYGMRRPAPSRTPRTTRPSRGRPLNGEILKRG
ncbi:MAG: class I SAM-dependent methyltransferase [Thermoplasmata archaeon]